ECLNPLVLRGDRPDLSPQIGEVRSLPAVRRNPQTREHTERSKALPPCPPGHLPRVPAFDAGPRISLRLPGEPHAIIVTAQRGRVKRLLVSSFAARSFRRCFT